MSNGSIGPDQAPTSSPEHPIISRGERVLLDRLALQAWPPLEQQQVEGWVLRAAGGVTKRANSALPLDVDVQTIDDVLPQVAGYYAERGLPTLAQVSDPAVHAALDARQWSRDFETVILTGPVSTGSAGVEVLDAPTQAWLDCWWAVDGRGGDDELDVARQMMARTDAPTGYASVRLDGAVVAVARGVAQEGWLGVFSMAVLPAARRRGLATEVLRGLGDWSTGHAAASTYLQVAVGNAPALQLYGGLALTQAYRYCYRSPP